MILNSAQKLLLIVFNALVGFWGDMLGGVQSWENSLSCSG